MSALRSARELGLVACHACGQVCRVGRLRPDSCCPRCLAPLQWRKPDSLRRSWALVLAAAALYLPANLLPIMQTTNFFDVRTDTILSGIVALWQAGSWDLAIIVFVASIVVPVLKIGVLVMLLVSVQRGSPRAARERTRLYRLIEIVGHWSMLDVFVVALLVGLVHFNNFADVQPGGGAIAFAAVVILTMLASMSFDPRLIWEHRRGPGAP